ncbi:MAG: YjbQ family protein [Proteobacteria bacterium]|nr:MAG: YjbQ family protein [Pseudomonadota bacterium]TDJ69387.1 MAG: YjbQ family protein [Pseudomonadota bacterium]
MVFQQRFDVSTKGRGTYEITATVVSLISSSKIGVGLCNVFVQHTSASLIVCENADPDVRRDLETFMCDLVPDGDRRFVHRQEGPDDMPAHIRSVLTQTSITIPVSGGRCGLGIWQGIYLWEHRTSPYRRQLLVTVCGAD